jgi:hypothetical protein
MVNAIYNQYKGIMDENVQKVENQLNVLLENTLLEEKEVELKMEVLNRRARALQQIQKDLSVLYKELSSSSAEKVGARP